MQPTRLFSRLFYTEAEAVSAEDDERSSDGGNGSSESHPDLDNGNGCSGEGDECQGRGEGREIDENYQSFPKQKLTKTYHINDAGLEN